MVLPDICPLTKKKGCKRAECYLYHVDWRTGEENCSIGYRYTHRVADRPTGIQDTYAQDTRDRLTRKTSSVPDQNPPISDKNMEDAGDGQVIREKVITVDRNVTVIGSDMSSRKISVPSNDSDTVAPESKKEKKNIDRTIAFDLPDDYEEKFWSK